MVTYVKCDKRPFRKKENKAVIKKRSLFLSSFLLVLSAFVLRETRRQRHRSTRVFVDFKSEAFLVEGKKANISMVVVRCKKLSFNDRTINLHHLWKFSIREISVCYLIDISPQEALNTDILRISNAEVSFLNKKIDISHPHSV